MNTPHFLVPNTTMSYADYINQCRAIIKERRIDLHGYQGNRILDANSPFELPAANAIDQKKIGVLLIHGLFDCPFSMRELAEKFAAAQLFCRAVLLPGHGTQSADLLNVTYQDWIDTVKYGIEMMHKDVDELFLVGYSTGATLAIYHALQYQQIAGIIMIGPAVRVKPAVDLIARIRPLIQVLSSYKKWVYIGDEIDYTKYQSVTVNAVDQVYRLTLLLEDLQKSHALTCPLFLGISLEDETVSSRAALKFFSSYKNPHSECLLYSSSPFSCDDARVKVRDSTHFGSHIKNIAHICLPFSPNNFHYGPDGDFAYASRPGSLDYSYGAYNRMDAGIYALLYRLGLIKKMRRGLTYNPDFEFFAKQIIQFILR